MTTAAVTRRDALPAPIVGWRVPSSPRLLVGAWLCTALCALSLSAAMAVDAVRTEWRRSTPTPPPAVALLPLFLDLTPLEVPTTVGWRKVPQRVTHDDLLRDPTLWLRMHLEDWDAVPEPVRSGGLDAMLGRHAGLLAAPRAWDAMTAADWDLVPQPVRATAFLHMVEYWSGAYRLGEAHGVPRRLATDTAIAVVMTESWFEHRAVQHNRWGNRDLGLGQASDFARRVMRTLWAAGLVDVLFEDEDYFDPWKASRFVVLWLGLALDESGGDLGLAVRAYHRGIGAARAGEGAEYLEDVQRRLRRYLRDEQSPPAWRHLRGARDRTQVPAARPLAPATPAS